MTSLGYNVDRLREHLDVLGEERLQREHARETHIMTIFEKELFNAYNSKDVYSDEKKNYGLINVFTGNNGIGKSETLYHLYYRFTVNDTSSVIPVYLQTINFTIDNTMREIIKNFKLIVEARKYENIDKIQQELDEILHSIEKDIEGILEDILQNTRMNQGLRKRVEEELTMGNMEGAIERIVSETTSEIAERISSILQSNREDILNRILSLTSKHKLKILLLIDDFRGREDYLEFIRDNLTGKGINVLIFMNRQYWNESIFYSDQINRRMERIPKKSKLKLGNGKEIILNDKMYFSNLDALLKVPLSKIIDKSLKMSQIPTQDSHIFSLKSADAIDEVPSETLQLGRKVQIFLYAFNEIFDFLGVRKAKDNREINLKFGNILHDRWARDYNPLQLQLENDVKNFDLKDDDIQYYKALAVRAINEEDLPSDIGDKFKKYKIIERFGELSSISSSGGGSVQDTSSLRRSDVEIYDEVERTITDPQKRVESSKMIVDGMASIIDAYAVAFRNFRKKSSFSLSNNNIGTDYIIKDLDPSAADNPIFTIRRGLFEDLKYSMRFDVYFSDQLSTDKINDKLDLYTKIDSAPVPNFIFNITEGSEKPKISREIEYPVNEYFPELNVEEIILKQINLEKYNLNFLDLAYYGRLRSIEGIEIDWNKLLTKPYGTRPILDEKLRKLCLDIIDTIVDAHNTISSVSAIPNQNTIRIFKDLQRYFDYRGILDAKYLKRIVLDELNNTYEVFQDLVRSDLLAMENIDINSENETEFVKFYYINTAPYGINYSRLPSTKRERDKAKAFYPFSNVLMGQFVDAIKNISGEKNDPRKKQYTDEAVEILEMQEEKRIAIENAGIIEGINNDDSIKIQLRDKKVTSVFDKDRFTYKKTSKLHITKVQIDKIDLEMSTANAILEILNTNSSILDKIPVISLVSFKQYIQDTDWDNVDLNELIRLNNAYDDIEKWLDGFKKYITVFENSLSDDTIVKTRIAIEKFLGEN